MKPTQANLDRVQAALDAQDPPEDPDDCQHDWSTKSNDNGDWWSRCRYCGKEVSSEDFNS